MGLMELASNPELYTYIIWAQFSEYVIRVSKFLLCHPLWPYLCLIIRSNIETDAPTDKIGILGSIT
jgi:hypothetical protein